VPDITASVYPAIQYFDSVREQRTGLSQQSQGLDANALQNQSATAVAQVFSASQMRTKLIARIM
ncbi:portal protein, partial [Bradyrhizobium jicamae]